MERSKNSSPVAGEGSAIPSDRTAEHTSRDTENVSREAVGDLSSEEEDFENEELTEADFAIDEEDDEAGENDL